MTLELPRRYTPVNRLGQGGGGEVWAVEDRGTGGRFALKVLAEGASEREMAALVREAVALSGLEGLGAPRVVRFGRLPGTLRPFMLRELVEGRSLEELVANGADVKRTLDALAGAADQLTILHRSGLLHGDIKPANIIVQPSGRATLVDLGLAAPWREGGSRPEGLTPRYAAPELFEGKPLTVRAEVYALGVALSEALEAAAPGALEQTARAELDAVARRATADAVEDRFPSADEFASALRRAAGLRHAAEATEGAGTWPVVGIDAVSAQLLELVRNLAPGGVVRILGAPGSGRSAVLRRLAWSLGVEGQPLAYVDEAVGDVRCGLDIELSAHGALHGVAVLVDDADALDESSLQSLRRARDAGARLVLVGSRLAEGSLSFTIPPLEERAALDLVRRAIPSLTERLQRSVVESSGGRPGELRRLVRLIAAQPVASTDDIERVIGSAGPDSRRGLPDAPLERAVYFLDRGRFNDARAALDELAADDGFPATVARARLELGIGEAAAARARLEGVASEAARAAGTAEALEWALQLGRAHLLGGDYKQAEERLRPIAAEAGAPGAEATAYLGLVHSYLDRHDEARAALEQAVERAQAAGNARVEAVALACSGLALQRADRLDEAREAYERAIDAGERASEAGVLAMVQLNLAGLLKVGGEMARAIEHFEAAVDMGRRSGRKGAARAALLNLANTDLYLGRLARARTSIEALEEQREQLPPVVRAQLTGAQAELAAKNGQLEQASRLYEACAAAFEALGRGIDAAEALLEAALVASRSSGVDVKQLRRQVERAAKELGDAPAHRSLMLLARARVDQLAGDELAARAHLDRALAAAREAGQREFTWRALEARAELSEAGGQPLTARRDREEALAVLEEIGARLPRDLREVYWNDPRRRQLRSEVHGSMASAATEFVEFGLPRANAGSRAPSRGSRASASISELTQTPLEQRLARILEINSELAGEHDLAKLTARVVDHAVDLLRAERGFLLLTGEGGKLSVHTSRARGGDDPHAEFSRSIAEEVLRTGQPIVSLNARSDSKMKSYTSVHQLMLESVACVPILAPSSEPIGALYLETRLRPGSSFERELPTLRALSDQVAIAIENARLITENRGRADELGRVNQRLEEAQERLRELLGERTEKLKQARRKLRDARDTLYGHFGYQGLVGTSTSMRRVYALIDRVKNADVPVLITGESGTGKEVVARAIHDASLRAKARFLGINCGAIPEHLLESELFGHVRGAFTGAERDRKGLVREGEGGSVLLDEIAEMSQKMQAGLLRVLQEKKVRPVGGTNEEPIDVRFVFATNRDLAAMVSSGKFREDLYYRIHVVEVRLPPLRERSEDIAQLVDYFLGIFAARYKRERKAVTREAMRRLTAYDWPGNVRQLENVLLNAWVLSERPELEADDIDLPDGWEAPPDSEPLSEPPPEPERALVPAQPRRRKGSLSQHRLDERERIITALKACNWNRVKAAELSGIPRRTFYRRLREYGIQ